MSDYADFNYKKELVSVKQFAGRYEVVVTQSGMERIVARRETKSKAEAIAADLRRSLSSNED